jgi:hypothetical protein
MQRTPLGIGPVSRYKNCGGLPAMPGPAHRSVGCATPGEIARGGRRSAFAALRPAAAALRPAAAALRRPTSPAVKLSNSLGPSAPGVRINTSN